MRNQTTKALERLKQEIATEMGIELGAEQTARNNGKVGGHMTKKLIALGQQRLTEMMEEESRMPNYYIIPEQNKTENPYQLQ